jgi:hypothetical protein
MWRRIRIPLPAQSGVDPTGRIGDCQMGNTNRPTQRDRLRLIVEGVAKHYATGTLVVQGSTLTGSDLQNVLKGYLGLLDAADADKAQWRKSVKAAKDEASKRRPFLRALKGIVTGQFGHDLSALADFGYPPPRAAKTKVAVKAEAQVKASATRKARGTVGSKAKLKVKSAPAPKTSAPA